MSKVNFRGLGVALITPFKEEGSVDFEALSRLLDFQLANGTDYIVALGTTAETPTLSGKEKVEIVRFIVEKVNGTIPVVMGVGGKQYSLSGGRVENNRLHRRQCNFIGYTLLQ